MASLKGPKLKQTMLIDSLEVKDEKELQMDEPAESLEEVQIDPTDLTKVIKVGSGLDVEKKLVYQSFSKNSRMFLLGPIVIC